MAMSYTQWPVVTSVSALIMKPVHHWLPARVMSATIRAGLAVVSATSFVSVFVRGTDNALWHGRYTSSGWTGLSSLGGNVAILASDAVDTEAEAKRAAAERTRLETEIKRAQGKLANEGFTAKAPPAVVQAERDKLARLQSDLDALE